MQQGRGAPYRGGPPPQRKRLNRSDKQVVEAVEVFKQLFAEAEEAKAKAEAAKAEKEAEAAKVKAEKEAEAEKPEATEDAAAAPEAMADETPADGEKPAEEKEEEKPKAKPATLTTQELGNGYRTKTSNNFKFVFKRAVNDFLSMFTDTFASVSSNNVYRMLTEEEIAAAKAKRQKQKDDRAKQLAEQRAKQVEKALKEREGVRAQTIHVMVASDSILEKEAARRAVTAVLASSRLTQFSRVVMVGSDDCDPKKKLTTAKDVLAGATARLENAFKRKVMMPPLVPEVFDHEPLYKSILPDDLDKVIAQEEEDKKKAEEERKAAKKAAEEARLARKKEKEDAKKEKEDAKKKKEEGDDKKEEVDDKKEEEAEKEKEVEAPAEEEKKAETPAEEAKEEEAEEKPAPPTRVLVVPDFYVSVETAVIKQSFPKIKEAGLPTLEAKVEEDAKAMDETKDEAKEKKDEDAIEEPAAEEKELTPVQKASAEVKALIAAKTEFEDIDASDKHVNGSVWQSLSWVVVYNSRTGCVARVPTAAVTFTQEAVDKAMEDGFDQTSGEGTNVVTKCMADRLAETLEINVSPTDPHLILSAGIVSQGHILQQALTIAFGQIAQKEMARFRVGVLKRNKAIAAAQAVLKEERQKEAAAKAEKKKAEAEAKKKAAEEAKAEAEAKKKAEAEAKKAEEEAKAAEEAKPEEEAESKPEEAAPMEDETEK